MEYSVGAQMGYKFRSPAVGGVVDLFPVAIGANVVSDWGLAVGTELVQASYLWSPWTGSHLAITPMWPDPLWFPLSAYLTKQVGGAGHRPVLSLVGTIWPFYINPTSDYFTEPYAVTISARAEWRLSSYDVCAELWSRDELDNDGSGGDVGLGLELSIGHGGWGVFGHKK
jgi:hypothetical protein